MTLENLTYDSVMLFIEPVEDTLRIYQVTTNVGETEGNPALFTCRATQGMDKATPQVKWSLGGNLIENDVDNGVIVSIYLIFNIAYINVTFQHQFNHMRLLKLNTRREYCID